MMPKRPVVFPDIDPRRVLGDVPCSTTAQAWKAYGDALLDFNEPCMEACESTSEIVDALYVQRSGICARENGGERFRLSWPWTGLLTEAYSSVSRKGPARSMYRTSGLPTWHGSSAHCSRLMTGSPL